MMEHISLEDLSAYLDDELPAERRSDVEAHAAACAACRAEYESLAWSVAFTRALPRTPIPRGASLRVPLTDIDAPGTRWRFNLGWLAFGTVTAVLVVALAATLWDGPFGLVRTADAPQMTLIAPAAEEAAAEVAEEEPAAEPADLAYAPAGPTEDDFTGRTAAEPIAAVPELQLIPGAEEAAAPSQAEEEAAGGASVELEAKAAEGQYAKPATAADGPDGAPTWVPAVLAATLLAGLVGWLAFGRRGSSGAR